MPSSGRGLRLEFTNMATVATRLLTLSASALRTSVYVCIINISTHGGLVLCLGVVAIIKHITVRGMVGGATWRQVWSVGPVERCSHQGVDMRLRRVHGSVHVVGYVAAIHIGGVHVRLHGPSCIVPLTAVVRHGAPHTVVAVIPWHVRPSRSCQTKNVSDDTPLVTPYD